MLEAANAVRPYAPAVADSPINLALSHATHIANDNFELVLELRKRLSGVLNPSRPDAPPPSGGATRLTETPAPVVPVVATLTEITTMQNRTADVLRSILGELAL